MRRPARSRWSVVARATVLALKAAVAALALATPLVGVWTASSLAAHAGRATWWPIVAGALAFPIAPLAWEAWAERRRRKKRSKRERILTFGDRILLRTFALNFTLLALLLALRPKVAFTALSTRGDWMLDGRHGPLAERARRVLFRLAGGLEWLHELSHENRFEKLVDADENAVPGPSPPPPTPPVPRPGTAPAASAALPETAPAASAPPRPNETAPRSFPDWPQPAELHPLVRDFPPDQEASLEAVARFIRSREPDARARIKALHDWIADRVAYDVVALTENRIPAQDAASVFATRRAVCAGYANLFKAMARVTGDEVVVVVGDARTDIDDAGGGGHAWNAAKIEGQWHLIDVTWDAGYLKRSVFVKEYSTDYLMTPPEVFGVDHFPAEQRWQLRAQPSSRGDFVRQPMLRARFFAHGFRLESPDRSQVSVGSTFEARLENPRGAFVLAELLERSAPAGGQGQPCDVTTGPRVVVRCTLPGDGVYRVNLFAGPERYGRFEQVGTFEVASRR